MAKSNKTVQEALSAVLQKHNLKPQDALVTIVSLCMYEQRWWKKDKCLWMAYILQPLFSFASWNMLI